jgi:hypothetical protein
MPRTLTATTCGLILAAIGALLYAETGTIFPHRWVYISRRLQSDQDVEDIRRIAGTAAENGLNGVLFALGLDSIDLKPPEYTTRLEKVKQICKQNRLEMIPNIFSAGYGGGILAHDRNLAEGFLVKDLLYVAKSSEAHLVPEVVLGDSGPAAEGLWTREVAVKPNRCYRITFRAKTEGLPATRRFTSGAFRLIVQTSDKRNLTPWNARIPPTTDWREVRWGFNSQSYDKVNISIGIRDTTAGKAWVDSVRVEEVGLLNVLRRPGTPVTIRADEGDTVYEEGRDYDRIVDPQLNFRFDHEGPPLRLLPGGRIRDGQKLRVSYYHGFSINDGQTSICMAEPKVYEIWRDMARRMHDAVAPPRYVLSMDEMREGGTCAACRGRDMAQLLGECLTKQFRMLREVNPKVDVWVWSDMLDPNHNARDKYYLVNGDYTGSWKHVPKELGIVTWYYERRALSLPFFSKLGFRTLAGAYYDADTLDNPRGWLEELKKTPNAQGIMYTTWQNKYELLAEFGKLASKERAE